MNTVDMMTKLLSIQEDVKKMPVSAERAVALAKISELIPEIVDISTAPRGNTGLPCPYCRQNLPRLDVHRTTDGAVKTFDICVSMPAQNRAEVSSLCRFLLDLYK